jgi:peptidoglycan/LPS O-acetylase OafA/YrhL
MQVEWASRNRVIDGWRGFSVVLVIVGHLVDFRFGETLGAVPFRSFFSDPHWRSLALLKQIVLRLLAALPSLGVELFFIISGYLITALLLREEAERGGVSLQAFYVRRLFRILPVFLAYLICLSALTAVGVIEVAPRNLVLSACFLCNLPGQYCSWWLGHTWTLSVEEQYYLIWPGLFIVLAGWRVVGVAAAIGLLTAASLVYPVAPGFAYIAMGALCALSPRARSLVDALGGSPLTIVFAAILLLPPFFASTPVFYNAINAAGPLMLAVIFFAAVNGRGPFLALVKWEALRRLGLISYSVYLWQQLFLGEPSLYEKAAWLTFPVLLAAPALVSYFAIERPFLSLGRRLSEGIKRRSRPLPRSMAYEAENVGA